MSGSIFRKYPAVLAVIFIAIALVVLEIINGRFMLNDFRVYYLAAGAFRNGGEVYGIAWGLGQAWFKYAPFTLFFFLPFTFLSYNAAAMLFYLLITSFLAGSFIFAISVTDTYLSPTKLTNRNLLIGLTFLFVANHLYREFHLGNVNYFLLFALLLSLLLTISKKEFQGGIIFGLALLFKPYLLLLAIVPFFHRKWKMLSATSLVLIGSFILQILINGYQKTTGMYSRWFDTMMEHSSHYASGNHLPALLQIHLNLKPSLILNWVALSAGACLLIFLILFNLLKNKRSVTAANILEKRFIMEWLIGISMIPSLVNADTQLFMLSFPLMMLVTALIIDQKSYLYGAALLIIFFFFGINANDVVGDRLGTFFDETGAVGISNLLLIFFGAYLLSTYQDRSPTKKFITEKQDRQ